MFQREEGAITVFFSITILVFIILATVITEGSRIRVAEVQGLRALEVSGNSVLAGYDSQLKTEYGLFALANADEAYIKNSLESYFLRNTVEGPSNNEAWSLYDYSLDDLQIILKGSLNEAPIVKEQILQLMKYKGIQSLGETLIDKLAFISSTEGTLQTLDKKLEFERQLQELSQLQQELNQLVEGAASFNIQRQAQIANEIYSIAINIGHIKAEIDGVEKEINSLRTSLQGASGEALAVISNSLYLCSLRLEALYQRLADDDSHIKQHLDALSKELETYLAFNIDIQRLIEEINSQKAFVAIKFEEYKEEMERNKGSLVVGIKEALNEEINLYESLFSPEELEQLSLLAKGNENVLKDASSQLLLLELKVLNYLTDFNQNILQEINSTKQRYNDIISQYSADIDYILPQAPMVDGSGDETMEDNRAASSKRAGEFLSNSSEDKDIILTNDIIKLLPSNKTRENYSFSHDIEFDEGREVGYTEKGLIDAASLASKLGVVGIELRDSLFINEYIMDVFNCYITQLKEDEKRITDGFKKTRSKFFDYEAEYIVYGKSSQQQNLTDAKKDLLLTRFVLNLIYVYTEPQLLKRATVIAATLSAPLAGASLPIIKTMVLAGWAMGYAVDDSRELMAGKEIPIMKKQEELKAEYRDYLRFFLLLRASDKEEQLYRIMDLIQLNFYKQLPADVAFTTKEFYSNLGIEGIYSIKYLFMKMPYVQSQMTSAGGRYKFNKTIWVGY